MKNVVVVLMLLALAGTAPAIELQYVNSALYAGMPTNLRYQNGHVFGLSEGGGGLQVISVADANNPMEVGGFPLHGQQVDLSLEGNSAFVAAKARGLYVLDIAVADNPSLSAQYTGISYVKAVDVSGSYAYVISDSALVALDVTNPVDPAIRGQIALPGPAGNITVAGNRAYVGLDSTAAFLIYDISNPASPSLLAQAATPYHPVQIIIEQTYAYVLDYLAQAPMEYCGFRIFDITNAQSPALVGQYEIPALCKAIAVIGDYAYFTAIGWGFHGLKILNISDRTNPYLAGSVFSADNAHEVVAAGNRLYVTISPGFGSPERRSLYVVDITLPDVPVPQGRYLLTTEVWDLYVRGDYAYAVTGVGDGLQVMAIDEIQHIRRVGFQNDVGGVANLQIDVDSNFACTAATGSGLCIIDITEPNSPRLIRRVFSNHRTDGVCIIGDYVYLMNGTAGILILNLFDPGFSVEFSTPTNTWTGCVEGDYFYLATGHQWLIYNISDPANPSQVAAVNASGCRSVTISGHYALVSRDDEGITIWDIVDRTNPVEKGTCVTPGLARAIEVYDHYAFVATLTGGVQIVDFLDPLAPVIVGEYVPPGWTEDLMIQDDLLFVANQGMMLVLRIVNPDAVDDPGDVLPNRMALLANYPNPFNAQTTISYSLPADFAGAIAIYDIAGRLVRTLEIALGTDRITWDGLNAFGNPVASGIYFYTLAGHPETARKMVLLR